MFEKELESLLEKKWDTDQKELIKRLFDNLMYYKKIIPKSLKQDVFSALEICNILKKELEIYKEMCNILKKELEIYKELCKCIQEKSEQEKSEQEC